MALITINEFAGLAPELSAELLTKTTAQIAHNCLLWDGTLRPMPQWTQFRELSLVSDYLHISEDTKTGNIIEAWEFTHSTYLNGPPFADKVIVGIDLQTLPAEGYRSNLRVTDKLGIVADSLPLGLPAPIFAPMVVDGLLIAANISSYSISYSPQLHSKKPVNRIVGMTFCRKTQSGFEESTIALIPGQNLQGIMYEGDIINISVTTDINITIPNYGITHIRFYRTISGLDTGEAVGNELDTDWHLIATLPVASVVRFNDGGASTTDYLDLYLASHFYPHSFVANRFGLTQGGWFYSTSVSGKIQVSERYIHHAWPTENISSIPEIITDAVAHFDNIFIGTESYPYIAALAPGEGEQGVQVGVTPFPERLPCLPGTMAPGLSGALYASSAGVVALTRDGAKVLTAGLANAGDVLYKSKIDDTVTDEIRFELTTKGAYWQGRYFGFVGGNRDVPLNAYYTSHVYPIEVFEEMQSGSTVRSMSMVNQIDDEVSSNFALMSGVLAVKLKTTTIPIELIEGAFTVTGGILGAILHVSNMAPEAVSGQFSVRSGNMKAILVRNNMAPEAIGGQFTLRSGTLT